MTQVSRRTVLKGAAAAAGATAVGRLADILAHAQAPAYPKGTRLHLLQWSHYVQAADVLFDKQKDEFARRAPTSSSSPTTTPISTRARWWT
jgi:hypothetical protein